MTLFVISVSIVLIVSAICSLSEAAIYAVRLPFVRTIAEKGSRAGTALISFKENMERPISAILIVNTAANTAGAAVAGAQARVLFQSESAVIWFSAIFTLGVLFCSEIVPKVMGVAYNKSIARAMALPWLAIIKMLYPAIYVIQKMSALLTPQQTFAAPEEEVYQLAMLSAEEGSIMPYEAEMVSNVLHLDKVKTRDIMTPRPVVFKLPADLTLREVSQKIKEWNNSRIPIYEPDDPETWIGFVFTRDVLNGLANDQFDLTLGSLCQPLYFVSEQTLGHILLRSFLKRRTHLFGVVDEFGDITGIVTLEDVMESLIGEEIVDEADLVVNMQEVAKRRKREYFQKNDADGSVTRESPSDKEGRTDADS